jgi:hypothetical protein
MSSPSTSASSGEPVVVDLPHDGAVTLTAVRLHADDTTGLVGAVRATRSAR